MKFEPRSADHTVNVSAGHPLADAAKLAIGAALALLAVIVVLVFISDRLVTRISIDTEMRWFGALQPESLIGVGDDRDAQREAVAALVERLNRHWTSDYRFRVEISPDPAPNALAFPGGLIVVTAGLLAQIDSENELAFVLAHELGHFRNRDHLRQLGRTLAINLALSALGSSNGGQFGFGVADLANRSYGRDQESDADRFALELVNAEYGHLGHAFDFFERLRKDQGDGSRVLNFLDTHPLPGDRIAALRQTAGQQGWALDGRPTPWPGSQTGQSQTGR